MNTLKVSYYRARNTWPTKASQWIAHRLPARLRYFAAIDVVAYATTGKYGTSNVCGLPAMEAIGRFGKDKRVEGQ